MTSESDIAVGDPSRVPVGHAIVGTLLVAMVFFAFAWVTKELPALYVHEPWQDDPYDAVVSLALWCVPLLIALCALRIPLCRKSRPLPVRRVLDLLRVSRAVIAVVLVTLVVNWVSVATRAHASDWDAWTMALIAGLALVSVLAVAGAVALRRAGRTRLPPSSPPQPDWLADALALAERESHVLGPWRPAGLRALRFLDRAVVRRVRLHPVAAAGLGSVALAAALDTPQILLEGYEPALAALFVTISACSMFAFLVVAGTYLRIVGREPSAPRAVVVALVASAASVPLAASFRGSLWWVLGTTDEAAGLAELAELVLVAAAATGAMTLVVAGALRSVRRLGDSRP